MVQGKIEELVTTQETPRLSYTREADGDFLEVEPTDSEGQEGDGGATWEDSGEEGGPGNSPRYVECELEALRMELAAVRRTTGTQEGVCMRQGIDCGLSIVGVRRSFVGERRRN